MHFLFDNYIVERGVCSFGLPIRVERVKEWREMNETTISNLFMFWYLGKLWREGELTVSSYLTASVSRND